MGGIPLLERTPGKYLNSSKLQDKYLKNPGEPNSCQHTRKNVNYRVGRTLKGNREKKRSRNEGVFLVGSRGIARLAFGSLPKMGPKWSQYYGSRPKGWVKAGLIKLHMDKVV